MEESSSVLSFYRHDDAEKWTELLVASSVKQGRALEVNFESFAGSKLLLPFMRELIQLVEQRIGMSSYGLDVLDSQNTSTHKWASRLLDREEAKDVRQAAAETGFIAYVCGRFRDDYSRGDAPIFHWIDDLDAPVEYTDRQKKLVTTKGLRVQDFVISSSELVRSCLDFQARACCVIVIAPSAPSSVIARKRGAVVRRQSELTDEELESIWRAAAEIAQLHGGYQSMQLNAGSFQNVGNLHLKVFLDEAAFMEKWGEEPAILLLRDRHSRWNWSRWDM